MIPKKIQGILERGAAPNLWRNTLSQIPTVYGRLVYLSGLRDPNSGRYKHAGLALVFGESEADRALRTSHNQTFSEWICYDLEQQKTDLDLYLADLPENKAQVVATWSRLKPFRTVAPTTVSGAPLDTYLSDFDILMELLKNEYGVAVRD